MLENIRKYNIKLGSKSPRRRELMHMLRIPFDVVNIIGVEEKYPADMPALEVSQYLSVVKADAYMPMLHENDLIITADTLVILDGLIMGKPKTSQEAIEMLRSLSGKTHQVATGVTISSTTQRTSFTSVTEVTFSQLTDDEIQYYVDNFHPLDKAGAYGIQEWIGGVAVESINGSYYNVMGLPVNRLYRELAVFPDPKSLYHKKC